ncbi:hypothetical protein V6N13_001608 [Hibiscus sabdariffa]|uniref:Uncharacterized protein n=1 Tax=Hibiscus sabdariffa TaxID=183260 RepID=A0ABR2G913_9ROSI
MKGLEDRIHHLESQEQVSSANERKGEAVVSKTMEKVKGQVEAPCKDLVILNNLQESRVPSSDWLSMRAREDLSDMGLGLQDKGLRVSVEGNSSHSQGSSKDGCNQRPQDAVDFAIGEESFELPKLQYFSKISKKKERKFGSLKVRRDILLKEALNTLAVGKTVGIEFIGDEQEVIDDLISLAEKEQANNS